MKDACCKLRSSRLVQAKEDELEAWSEAVLTAPTLEAVFNLQALSFRW